MAVEFVSIAIFTFALALLGLGLFTWWVETPPKRTLGTLMMVTGLLIAAAYAFLGSRFAIAVFGHLIVTVDLPRLVARAVVYTLGVATGFAIAGALFLWITGRLIRPTRLEVKLGIFVAAVLAVALAISTLAIYISH